MQKNERKLQKRWLVFVSLAMLMFAFMSGGCGGGGGSSGGYNPFDPPVVSPFDPVTPDPAFPEPSNPGAPGGLGNLEGTWVGIPSQSSGRGNVNGMSGTLSLVNYSARATLRPGTTNEYNIGPVTCRFTATLPGLGSRTLDNNYSRVTEECRYIGNNQYRWGYSDGSYSESITVTVHSSNSATLNGSAQGVWYGYSGSLTYTIALRKQ